MTRRRRFFVPGYPQHVIQRGNNKQVIYRSDNDRICYIDYLVEAAEKHACAIHCYVLMGNHVHFLVTPGHKNSLGKTMQSVGLRYAQYYNKKYERTGGLWEGRYHASLVDTDNYLKSCYRYIELNPVRAGICRHAADYSWSSHRYHAFGVPDRLITEHRGYLDLNPDNETKRRTRYQSWFRLPVCDDELEMIRSSTQQGLVIGDTAFQQKMEVQLGQAVLPHRRGRKRNRVRHVCPPKAEAFTGGSQSLGRHKAAHCRCVLMRF
jgi:putative transposase